MIDPLISMAMIQWSNDSKELPAAVVGYRDFLQHGRLLAADAIPEFKSLDVTYFFSMIQ